MAKIHTVIRSSKVDGSNTIQSTEDVSADNMLEADVTVPASTTNQAISTLPITDRTKLQSLYILSSQAVTIKTNSTGSPDDTFTMTAGAAKEWTSAGSFSASNPLSANVTTWYVTNSGSAQARVRIRAGVNS